MQDAPVEDEFLKHMEELLENGILLLITMSKNNKEPHIQKEITFLETVLAIGNKKGQSRSWEMVQTCWKRFVFKNRANKCTLEGSNSAALDSMMKRRHDEIGHPGLERMLGLAQSQFC